MQVLPADLVRDSHRNRNNRGGSSTLLTTFVKHSRAALLIIWLEIIGTAVHPHTMKWLKDHVFVM